MGEIRAATKFVPKNRVVSRPEFTSEIDFGSPGRLTLETHEACGNKNYFQDFHRQGAYSPAVFAAIEQLWAEQAVSPWFGWLCQTFRLFLRHNSPSGPGGAMD